MTTKTTHNKAALVDASHHWIEIEGTPPPQSTKLLLINRKLGVAVIGNYTKGCGWTHYAGLPTFKEHMTRPTTCPHCYGISYDSSGYACICQQAEVAKVGRKYHDRDPLRGSPWRLYLKDLARSLLLVLAVMMISAGVVGLMTRT